MNHRVVVNGLRVFWIVITIWYELGVFFNSGRNCDWPDSTLLVTSSQDHYPPSHVLLVADPQILDHRSYPERGPYLTFLTRLVVDLNLRKNWWVALRKRPHAVVFLGDMMDGGRFDMADNEYERYYQRFKSIFVVPREIPTYFIPGNHDIGLRASTLFSPYAHARYMSHFGPLNSQVTIANHTLVLLDAPSLVEEDNERLKHAKTYKDWTPRRGGPVELVKSIAREPRNGPVVLLSHIPLSRDTFDCGPLREKGTIRPGIGFGYQNSLGKEVTGFLLEELQPSVIFSGDDHDYCEILHPSVPHKAASQIREVSVKSLSMAMGIKRPGFQLLSLAPQGQTEDATEIQRTHADVPCILPDQIAMYLSAYIPLLLVSLFVVLVSNALCVRNLPSKTRQHRRRSSSPQTRTTLRFRQSGDSSDEEHWSDNSSHLLPHPASTPLPKSFMAGRYLPIIFGRRRRIMCSDAFCLATGRKTRQQNYGVLSGFVRDTRDVAVFPLSLFVMISLWISFS